MGNKILLIPPINEVHCSIKKFIIRECLDKSVFHSIRKFYILGFESQFVLYSVYDNFTISLYVYRNLLLVLHFITSKVFDTEIIHPMVYIYYIDCNKK